MEYEQWQEQIREVLWQEAMRQGLNHSDELDINLSLYIQHRMAEEWINYKARTGQLILS